VAERVLTGDGSWTIASARYGETYRSRHGALGEAWHVFVAGSGVAARLADGRATRVLEVGLGTCLNLALTVSLALRHGALLRYLALEHDPLPGDVLAGVGLEAVAGADVVRSLLAWRADWEEAGGHAVPAWRHGSVEVRVVLGDAVTARLPTDVDAVYLDGFSPRVNPELWTPAALARFASCLLPGGVLATYTVSGRVRRGLAAAGLRVERRPGPPGGKREALVATRPLGATEPAEPRRVERDAP
jgi:tRNA U34 5-methylaminomethyl-2-thiouridine-forming methyltransferase MnmC